MIRPLLNGIGIVTFCLCYIFTTLEMRTVCEELGYLNTMRRLWVRQREPRVWFPAESRDSFLSSWPPHQLQGAHSPCWIYIVVKAGRVSQLLLTCL